MSNFKLIIRDCKRKKKESLDLSNQELTIISDTIFDFDFLKKLNLSDNNLWKIDSNINKLKNLEVLDLRNNNLESLPIEVVDMENLKTIFLEGNNFCDKFEFLNSGIDDFSEIKKRLKLILKNVKSFEDEFLDDDEFLFTPTKKKLSIQNKNQENKENKENQKSEEEIKNLKKEIEILKSKLKKASENDLIEMSSKSDLLFTNEEEITEKEQIAQGGFSIIKRGYFRGTEVVIKKFFDPKISEENKQEFMNEVEILKKLRHPYIITMMAYQLKKQKNDHKIIFEFPGKNNLHKLLHFSQIKLNNINFLKKLAQVFNYIHKSQIAHRDIKSLNILVTENLNPKIIDFGLAREKKNLNRGKNCFSATPSYCAPEIFLKKKITEKVDIFAFGILMWEILMREIPFDCMAPLDIKERVVGGGEVLSCKSLGSGVSAIIKRCLCFEPRERPSFEEVLSMLEGV